MKLEWPINKKWEIICVRCTEAQFWLQQCDGFHLKPFSGLHQKVSLELCSCCTKKDKFASRAKRCHSNLAEQKMCASMNPFSPFQKLPNKATRKKNTKCSVDAHCRRHSKKILGLPRIVWNYHEFRNLISEIGFQKSNFRNQISAIWN